MNTLYPIFLSIAGEPVLVVGGGAVAEQKVDGLLACGGTVTVIAPDLTQKIRRYGEEQTVTVVQREYRDGDAAGYFLVIGATDDRAVQERIRRDARRNRIPVNIADVPELCNFYLGSVFTAGDLKVAVSTNGKSPTLGKIIRDRIAAEFGEGYPDILGTMGGLRPEVMQRYTDYDARKEAFERIVLSELEKIGKA
jgi:precorrin-2 dehydrogenase / sirohydrochlorin ferrochelatase